MDVDWKSQWGNWIVTHRSPETWREYGDDAGRTLARNEWDEFLFWRDADQLAISTKAVDRKAGELAREMVDDFRLYGSEMHVQHHGETSGTPAERRIWVDAFVRGYSSVMDRLVGTLIQPRLMKNLDLFCTLLSWMRHGLDHGDGSAPADYGLRLAGKKAPPEPKKPTYHPTRKELHDHAVRIARRMIDAEWRKFMARRASGHGFRSNMFHYSGLSDVRGDWAMSDLERDYHAEVLAEAFNHELGRKALELAPPEAWKNSYLICTLYDKMLKENPPKKEFVPSGEDRPDKGFRAKESRNRWDIERERDEWRQAERERILKDIEKSKRKEEARGKGESPKMSGRGDGPEALVLVHLSSLDSYTAHAGRDEGEALGERLTQAILEHQGPVIIVDQGWETGHRESRPRESLLAAIAPRPDVVWLPFDEAEERWEDFFPQLYAALDEAGARSAIVGGIWYDESLHTGCATFTYLTLRQRMPVVVDESLVGCE